MLRRAKQLNPSAIVVAMGCHAELSDTSSYADLCIGTQGKSRAVELVNSALEQRDLLQIDSAASDTRSESTSKKQASRHSYDDDPHYEELGLSEEQSETRAYLKIEDGCNSFCSYCAIPYARGRVRSRDEEQIIQEATILAKAGYKEIVLTGIHLCSYGLDRGEPSHAVALLAALLAEIPQLDRFDWDHWSRFLLHLNSLMFWKKTARSVRIFICHSRAAAMRHLSVMNRNYNTEQFRTVAADIRRRWPFAGITTDIITAFPGETDEEFERSYEFCREIGFSRMHIFGFHHVRYKGGRNA
jgi:threonylcarbamoyladenosine tRNA methylthiotransferase MtaB